MSEVVVVGAFTAREGKESRRRTPTSRCTTRSRAAGTARARSPHTRAG